MTDDEFEKIINDIISSYMMEQIVIPDEIIQNLKKIYINKNLNNKILVKSRGGLNNDNGRK